MNFKNIIYIFHDIKWQIYIIAFLTILCELFFIDVYMADLSGVCYGINGFILNLIISCVNTLVVLFPYFLINGRYRWTVLIPIWVIAIFGFANMVYFDFYALSLPLADIFNFNNYDPVLFHSIPALIKYYHFIIIVPAIVSSILIIKKSHANSQPNKFSLSFRIIAVIASILPFTFLELKAITSYPGNFCNQVSIRYGQKQYFFRRLNYFDGGLAQFFLRTVSTSLCTEFQSNEPNSTERNLILSFWEKHNKNIVIDKSLQNIFSKNRNKNLIFIVVESLNSEAVYAKVNGRLVMPTLNAIANDSSAIVCDNMKTQVLTGMSSDGQFMYNTGLYPSSMATTANEYGQNKFFTLASILSHNSTEIICETATFWNHDKTNKAYGYDGFIFEVAEIAKKLRIPTDQAFFEKTIEFCSTAKQPFFVFAPSLGMHSPCRSDRTPIYDWINNSNYIDSQRNYYNMCYYFDQNLSKFIDYLKRSNLYDNSIIVIASDHYINVYEKKSEIPIFFAILNCGVGKKIHTQIAQVDVFPSILEAMGYYPAKNPGMGYSIFNPNFSQNKSSILTSEADERQTVSDMMLHYNLLSTKDSILMTRSIKPSNMTSYRTFSTN